MSRQTKVRDILQNDWPGCFIDVDTIKDKDRKKKTRLRNYVRLKEM